MDFFQPFTKYLHEEEADNLKVALVQEKEESADKSGPTIYEQLCQILKSKSKVTLFMKVRISIWWLSKI